MHGNFLDEEVEFCDPPLRRYAVSETKIHDTRSCDMVVIAKERKKLTLSQKVSRLASRLRNPEWRRYGGLLLGGKLMGLAMVLMIMAIVSGLFFTHAFAQSAAPEVQAADVVNPVNTVWTLVAAFLVFGMQVGFTMLEAGFCRSRE